jgi:acetyl-CoA/propionyl-CoA carboxylase biotin carboxyl carrier protein
MLQGHAIECRVNAENPAKNFLPAPGKIGEYREPAGPGVRVDSAAEADYTIPQAYDPLISKLICYGATRDEARRRMLRALSEYRIEGIKTTIPFHSLMLADERFVTGDYHTGTVENEKPAKPKAGEPVVVTRELDVEVDGKRFSVRARERLETTVARSKPRPPKKSGGLGGGGGETLAAPMQGTIVKVLVKQGQTVAAGDAVCVLEAMKMENSILAHAPGTVEELKVEAGQSVEAGTTIAVIR